MTGYSTAGFRHRVRYATTVRLDIRYRGEKASWEGIPGPPLRAIEDRRNVGAVRDRAAAPPERPWRQGHREMRPAPNSAELRYGGSLNTSQLNQPHKGDFSSELRRGTSIGRFDTLERIYGREIALTPAPRGDTLHNRKVLEPFA